MGKHPILGLGQKKSGGAKKKVQGHYLMKKLSVFVFFFWGVFSDTPTGPRVQQKNVQVSSFKLRVQI